MRNTSDLPEIEFVYRHLDRSDTLESVAFRKIQHTLLRLPRKPVAVKLIFSINAGKQHISLHVHSGFGHDIFSEAEHDNMYSAIDILNRKLDQQIEKHRFQIKKDKIIRHIEPNL